MNQHTSSILRHPRDLIDRRHISHNTAENWPRPRRLHHLPHKPRHISRQRPHHRIISTTRDRSLASIDVYERGFGRHIRLIVGHAEIVHKVAVQENCVFEGGGRVFGKEVSGA